MTLDKSYKTLFQTVEKMLTKQVDYAVVENLNAHLRQYGVESGQSPMTPSPFNSPMLDSPNDSSQVYSFLSVLSSIK